MKTHGAMTKSLAGETSSAASDLREELRNREQIGAISSNCDDVRPVCGTRAIDNATGLSDLRRARHRGSALLDECGSAGLYGCDSRQELRHQRPEIGQPVRFRLKNDDGNRE